MEEEMIMMGNLGQGIEDKALARGLERGRQEGMELGKMEAVRELLASGFDKESVIKAMKLSPAQIQDIYPYIISPGYRKKRLR